MVAPHFTFISFLVFFFFSLFHYNIFASTQAVLEQQAAESQEKWGGSHKGGTWLARQKKNITSLAFDLGKERTGASKTAPAGNLEKHSGVFKTLTHCQSFLADRSTQIIDRWFFAVSQGCPVTVSLRRQLSHCISPRFIEEILFIAKIFLNAWRNGAG